MARMIAGVKGEGGRKRSVSSPGASSRSDIEPDGSKCKKEYMYGESVEKV